MPDEFIRAIVKTFLIIVVFFWSILISVRYMLGNITDFQFYLLGILLLLGTIQVLVAD